MSKRTDLIRNDLRSRLASSAFKDVDYQELLISLRKNGVAFGLNLPTDIIEELREFANNTAVFADRETAKGFHLENKADAERALGKPILVAQYLNTETGSSLVRKLRSDPLLELIALEYLGSAPKHVGTNMWWTFPVNASYEDRTRHAHVFHYDLDDFAFLKFFFYLTDVSADDGPHVCVATSHTKKPVLSIKDRFLVRRYLDSEIEAAYPPQNILMIGGAAGTGFAEDTLCIHKGATPTCKPRLLLQFQYALFDYGVQRDEAPVDRLKLLV